MPQVVIQHRVEKNKRIILTEAKVDDLKVYYIPEFPYNVPLLPSTNTNWDDQTPCVVF